MKVSELTAKQGNVEVEGVIREIGDARVYNKYGKELKVADAIFEDSSGTIKLTLWNDDAERFKPGDRIKVLNGYVGEYQGEKQLTSGKFGRIEKISENITPNSEVTPNADAKDSEGENPLNELDDEQIEEEYY